MRFLLSLTLAAVGATLGALGTAERPEARKICVAPAPKQIASSAPGYECAPGQFSYRIGDRPVTQWSSDTGVAVEGLDTSRPHRVRIFCDGKPHQSFSFRFAEYKSKDLCLFLDGYLLAQLSERQKRCKCGEGPR